MNPDKFQAAWQSQPSGPELQIDPAILLREVQRNQRSFRTTIFWRDFREVFAAIALIVWSLYDVFRDVEKNWPWLLMTAAALWVGGYFLYDRWRQRQSSRCHQETLLACVNESLHGIEHQIWLLKNVFWWYLLPLALGGLIPLAYMFLVKSGDDPWGGLLLLFTFTSAILCLVFWGVYRVNQLAVRAHLEPRRDELLALRESLIHDGD